MRWPFHFGRREVAEKATAAPSARREWASLPPIQRVIGEPVLTAPTSEFVDSLAGAHEPDLGLEPLGHHVSLDGPHGLVVARSIETYAPSTQMVNRPRPRQMPVSRAVDGGAPGSEDPVFPIESTEPAPEELEASQVRSLPVVESSAPSQIPLTRLSPAATVLVAAHQPPASRALTAEVETFISPPIDAAPSAAVSPAPASQVQRLTLGQSRRLGLGAPLKTPAPVAQRTTEQAPAPLDVAPAPRPALPDAAPESHAPQTTRGASSVEPLERPLVTRRLGHVDPAEPATLNLEAGQPSTVHDETAPVAPRAVAAAVGVQRVIARGLPPLFAPPVASGSVTVPLAPRRAPTLTIARGAGEPAPAEPVSVQPILTEQPLPIRGPAAAPFADFPPLAQRSLVAVNRPVEPVFGVPTSISLPPLPLAQREAVSTPVTTASPTVQVPGRPAEFAFDSPLTFVQRAGPAASEGPSSPENEEAGSPAAAPAPGMPAAAPAVAPAAGSGPGATPMPQSEHDLAELARRLYEPISARLRRDLLVERERAGMVTDLR